jgi:hypothetical protein
MMARSAVGAMAEPEKPPATTFDSQSLHAVRPPLRTQRREPCGTKDWSRPVGEERNRPRGAVSLERVHRSAALAAIMIPASRRVYCSLATLGIVTTSRTMRLSTGSAATQAPRPS